MKVTLEELKHCAREHDEMANVLRKTNGASASGLIDFSKIAFVFAYLSSKDPEFWNEWNRNKEFICETALNFSKGKINYNI